ncbi:MAG: hypothetical protein MUC83_05275 [Pirellula sp.]|nr:hypothetical protein [Pirellula sp.]
MKRPALVGVELEIFPTDHPAVLGKHFHDLLGEEDFTTDEPISLPAYRILWLQRQ